MHSLIWLKASDYLVRSFSCDFLKIRVPTANYDLQTMFYSYYYNFLKCKKVCYHNNVSDFIQSSVITDILNYSFWQFSSF